MGVFPPRSHVFLFSLLLTALTISLSISEPAKECPDKWEKREGFCYLVNNSKLSWSGAQETCRNCSGNLVKIGSKRENEIVQALTGSSSEKDLRFWIGLYKNKSIPVASFNISEDELRYCPVCFKLNYSGKKQVETPCTSLYSSICVFRDSSNCGLGGKTFGEHCYLPVHHKITWTGARVNCLENNAELMTSLNVALLKNVLTHFNVTWIWDGLKIRLACEKLTQGWSWINGMKFNVLQNWSVAVNQPVYGWNCATLFEGRVYLWQNCSEKQFSICKKADTVTVNETWKQNGSSWYLFATQKLSWEDAWKNCSAQGGELLVFNTSDEILVFNALDEILVKTENVSVHYWLGLNKTRENRRICGLTEHNNSMHYEPSYCFAVKNLSAEKLPCQDKYPSVCMANILTGCPGGWKTIGSLCFLVVQKIIMSWDLSQKYCFEKNATLVPSHVFSNNISHLILNNISKQLSLSTETNYWIETRLFNAPNNPTKGWVWINGSNLNTSDGLGPGVLPHIGYEKRCAGTKKNGEWFGNSCSIPLSFICKAKPTLSKDVLTNSQKLDYLKNIDLDKIGTRKDCKELINKTVKIVSEIFENNKESQNQSINAEDVITALARIVNGMLKKDSFNTSMTIHTDKIELDMFTNSLEELKRLKNMTAGVQYLPFSSVEHFCGNRPTCIVERAIVKIKNVSLNVSVLLKDKNKAAFVVADVISIDCYANNDKIENLRENEIISIEFKSKDNKKLVNPNCVYLESGEWSNDGMNTSESNGDTVNCITNHLSSFAMVVIAAEEDGGHNEAFAYISYIGSGLSLIGLSFTLLCYVLLHKDLQVLNSTRHVVHLNLQLSLGLTQIIFLSGAGKTDAKVVCKLVAIFLHYFSLASFCWILLEGAMLYLKIISVFRGTVIGVKTFYAFGWGFPLFFVSIAVLVEPDAYGTDKWCWLSYDYGYFWVFFAPVIIVTTLNLVVLIAVMRVLFRVSKKNCNTTTNILNTLRGLLILFPALGMSWVFSIISVNHDAIVWKYCFAIFNSLQGFLVFFIYGVCNEEIRHSLKRRLGRAIVSSTSQVQTMPAESKM